MAANTSSVPRLRAVARLSGARSSWYSSRVPAASVQSTFSRQVLEQVDALYAFAYRLSRSGPEAEDLVQETFTRALAAMQQFHPNSNLRAWLFTILRNTFVDARRRARRAPLQDDAALENASDADSDLLRGDLELERMRRIVGEDIEAALQRLSDDARTVVLLDLEGFTEAEIAGVMGCAAGTVKSRLARARATLRSQLAEYGK